MIRCKVLAILFMILNWSIHESPLFNIYFAWAIIPATILGLEKIFEYLNDYNHIESMEWGLKQAEAFSKKFAKKWVIIKPQEMDFDEIKMLIRVACYLEYMEQKEGKNE